MLKEAAGIQRVVLKTGRTDLRRGIDGLKAIIILIGMDPLEKGTLEAGGNSLFEEVFNLKPVLHQKKPVS